MALTDASHLGSKKARPARPERTFGDLEGLVQVIVGGSLPFFEGQSWELIALPADLRTLRGALRVPASVVLEVPNPSIAVVDPEGMAAKLSFFPLMFANRQRLPFCRPIRDVLDYL